jgi:hypothetical protein
MRNCLYIIIALTGIVSASLPFHGCIDFIYEDVAPRTDSTTIRATVTIAELKSVYPGELLKLTSTTFYQIDSVIIEGIVVSDDKQGNFYKSIVLQDATGGIEVKLDKNSLYNDYPRGQRVVVYCNDLYLGDYGGLIQLGSVYTAQGVRQLGGLEGDVIIRKHVFRKGGTPVPVTPEPLTSTITAASFSKLVSVSNVQFKSIYSPIDGKHMTYADAGGNITLNHLLVGCSTDYGTLVVRTSGYAKFAGDTIPSLNGTVVGVLSYYNGTYQLLLRDTGDVNFRNARCQQ